MEVEKIKAQHWDYIIVGTGIGGSTLGLKLAGAGFHVLFLEKGKNTKLSNEFKGLFAEEISGKNQTKILEEAGRSSQVFYDQRGNSICPFLGSGTGGSSAIYGATLQRFKESDFENWPLDYAHFTQFYEQAELLYKVHVAEKCSHPDLKMMFHYLKDQNLNPYLLPMAHDQFSNCGPCQSYLCKNNCKNEAGKNSLFPALELNNTCLLAECEALSFEMGSTKANQIRVKYKDKTFNLTAKNFILSAGALFSPILLLESKNSFFPNGVGNSNDLVGRYLMRHLVDLYAIQIDSAPEIAKSKEFGFDDFYVVDGQKYGAVQSFGRLPPLKVIIENLEKELFFLKFFRPIILFILKIILADRLVICSILEDSPQFENRIWNENGKFRIEYKINNVDKKKVGLIRKKLTQLFKPFGLILIKSAEKIEMLAHACGTCRMGTDSQKSVVDVFNRVHGVENIYVVDSSFFPSSGGTNPGLTIAANSLRIADHLMKKDGVSI